MRKQCGSGAAHVAGTLRPERWLLACLLLLAAVPVLARSIAAVDLSWSTVDGGGGRSWSAGAGYWLEGTAGQPDAGTLSGGAYALSGGFWAGGATAAEESRLYLPLVMRSH